MKNTIAKVKLLVMALGAIFVMSCSADDSEDGVMGIQGPAGIDGVDGTNGIDGEDGAMGIQGTAGTDGVDGTNGIDGEDGNANVRTFTFDLSTFSGNEIALPFSELTQDVLDNDAILIYIQRNKGQYYPIPGISFSDMMEVELDLNNVSSG